jgi:phosphodiesterase/alkaline phosphatase D-like protein
VGRALTTVPAGTPLERMRFGFVSCSQYEQGYFSAYRHLADENPDVVMFLGDYIYEYVEQVRPTVRTHSDGPNGPVMRVYDRFRFGDLLEVSMIDGRQYRFREACYGPPNKGGGHLETDATCPERREEGRTMIGFAQEAWLGRCRNSAGSSKFCEYRSA